MDNAKDYEQLSVGDYVFVHLIDADEYGGTVRTGNVVRIGQDFFGDLMVALDDDNAPFYLDNIRAISNHGQTTPTH